MEFNLGDLVNIKYGKNQRKVQNPDGKYPILGTGGIMNYADSYLYDKPSILIGRKGTIDKIHFIDEPFWTIDTLFYTEINENLAVPKYLYYKLSTIDFSFYNEGTTIPSLRTETLKRIKIDLPSLSIQSKIAETLNKIDKKIDVNNNIIANLEELSQTLFKHWFIDFEFPDKNGNPYKSSGGEFITSELGDIPKGWEIKKLDEIATHKKESFNPKKEEAQTVAHFSLPAFDTDQMPVMDFSKDIKSNKWLINKDTILFSKMNPRTMRVWLPSIREELTNIASTEFVVLECDNDNVKSLIYNLSSTNIFKDFLLSNATGSTNSRQRVRPNIAVSFKLAFNDQIIKLYGQRVNSLMSKIISLRDENIYLNEIRDALLPKLMSGELELPDTLEV